MSYSLCIDCQLQRSSYSIVQYDSVCSVPILWFRDVQRCSKFSDSVPSKNRHRSVPSPKLLVPGAGRPRWSPACRWTRCRLGHDLSRQGELVEDVEARAHGSSAHRRNIKKHHACCMIMIMILRKKCVQGSAPCTAKNEENANVALNATTLLRPGQSASAWNCSWATVRNGAHWEPRVASQYLTVLNFCNLHSGTLCSSA